MATLTVRSGMSNFGLVTHVTMIAEERIRAQTKFHGSPLFAGLEAMAQLSALHVRFNAEFECHAFLLKVGRWVFPQISGLNGRFVLSADLRSHSRSAFLYHAEALGPGSERFSAELLIGTQPYDARFCRERIRAHYRKLLADALAPQKHHHKAGLMDGTEGSP